MIGEKASRQRRSRSFGAIAVAYDRCRPDYPAQLVDDVVALLPGPSVVEIGAGTGKATALFAARGLRIIAVEPDPAMADVLRARGLDVRIKSGTLETWSPPRRFDGLICAQAWHWTDPATRWARAAAALAPGGLLALMWNADRWADPRLAAEMAAIYAAHQREAVNSIGADDRPVNRWASDELAEADEFAFLGRRSYQRVARYSAQGLVDYVATHSAHSTLPAADRAALLADVRAAALAHGDEVVLNRRTDLCLGRRR